jgi:hypothetical protein
MVNSHWASMDSIRWYVLGLKNANKKKFIEKILDKLECTVAYLLYFTPKTECN